MAACWWAVCDVLVVPNNYDHLAVHMRVRVCIAERCLTTPPGEVQNAFGEHHSFCPKDTEQVMRLCKSTER